MMIMTQLPQFTPDEFNFGAYRLSADQRVYRFAPRDPENLDPYGPQNHPLPPIEPNREGLKQ